MFLFQISHKKSKYFLTWSVFNTTTVFSKLRSKGGETTFGSAQTWRRISSSVPARHRKAKRARSRVKPVACNTWWNERARHQLQPHRCIGSFDLIQMRVRSNINNLGPSVAKYSWIWKYCQNAFVFTRALCMLEKLSKCEVKAWLCWNLIILWTLRF